MLRLSKAGAFFFLLPIDLLDKKLYLCKKKTMANLLEIQTYYFDELIHLNNLSDSLAGGSFEAIIASDDYDRGLSINFPKKGIEIFVKTDELVAISMDKKILISGVLERISWGNPLLIHVKGEEEPYEITWSNYEYYGRFYAPLLICNVSTYQI